MCHLLYRPNITSHDISGPIPLTPLPIPAIKQEEEMGADEVGGQVMCVCVCVCVCVSMCGMCVCSIMRFI